MNKVVGGMKVIWFLLLSCIIQLLLPPAVVIKASHAQIHLSVYECVHIFSTSFFHLLKALQSKLLQSCPVFFCFSAKLAENTLIVSRKIIVSFFVVSVFEGHRARFYMKELELRFCFIEVGYQSHLCYYFLKHFHQWQNQVAI